MKTRILGIDPGKAGAIACIYETGSAEAYSYTDFQDSRELLEDFVKTPEDVSVVAFLEEPATQVFLPGGKVVHAAKLQRSLGRLEGLLLALNISTRLVKPKEWQKGIPGLAGAKGPDRKKKLREHAARIFPDAKPTLVNADALLIAEWGKRQKL